MQTSIRRVFHRSTIRVIRKMSTSDLKSIFSSAVAAVEPRKLIRDNLKLSDGHLLVGGREYVLEKPCYLVGFGKAVYGMVLEAEKILGNWFQEGVATVPKGIFQIFGPPPKNSKIRFFEGAENNLPDLDAMKGAEAIKNLAEGLSEKDLLLVIISGGGSALLPLPLSNMTLADKLDITKTLAKRGANIKELNSVRKRLSQLKGGGLAAKAHPANIASLIISDVIGDPIDFIASGPTAANTDDPSEAISIIRRYGLYDHISPSVRILLESDAGFQKDTPDVHNCIIGSNVLAAEAAVAKAEELGFGARLLSTAVDGDVGGLAEVYAELAHHITGCYRTGDWGRLGSFLKGRLDGIVPGKKGVCLVAAGEPTVVVKGGGKGGRNQQLALAFSVALGKYDLDGFDVEFLSCGTDGIDGPTDAAGAIGGKGLVDGSKKEGLDVQDFLRNNDSYSFFSVFNHGGNLVKIGHTGTNVMDIHVLLIIPETKD